MKPYSITRRVVTLVLLVELVAAIVVTAFAFLYERHVQFRAFDTVLRGHADTIMGAVEDADEATHSVMLDTTDLKLPRHDVYAVREEGLDAHPLGQSEHWHPDASLWQSPEDYVSLRINGSSYRGLLLHGVRVVDPMAANVRHPLAVLYASPTQELWETVFRSVQVFALANGLLLLLTAILVPILVRRSMQPLHTLAHEAAAVSVTAWHFAPSADVLQVTELRPLVAAMEDVLSRLERSFHQQRQFVGDAAHELKTAIAVVKSSIQLLELRARTPEEYKQGLNRCFADCLRMEELAQQMLQLARVEETGAPLPTEQSDLAAESSTAIAELTPVATLQGVTLVSGIDTVATVGIAPDLLRSLLLNLLANAIQHSPSGSQIHLRLERPVGCLHLIIEDSGDGIAPEALPYIFDRFYRGDASRSRKTGGTGLGLAICKSIVERAHGHIAIESTLRTGTTVRVTLPTLP